MLHAAHPVRFWDHDLGPDEERLLVGRRARRRRDRLARPRPRPGPGPRRVRGHPGRRGGRRRVGGARAARRQPHDAGGRRRRVRWRGARCSTTPPPTSWAPTISPDGTRLACVRETRSTATAPIDRTLLVVPLAGGDPQQVARGWDRWPEELCWVGDALHVTADDAGRRPVFRVTPDSDNPVRLTGDDGCYSDLVAAPGRQRALRAAERDRRPARTGAARPGRARPATGAAARPGRAARAARAPSPRSPRPPPTAPRCAPGSRSPTATGGRRCCSGSTAARWAAGTPGSGGGTRG